MKKRKTHKKPVIRLAKQTRLLKVDEKKTEELQSNEQAAENKIPHIYSGPIFRPRKYDFF